MDPASHTRGQSQANAGDALGLNEVTDSQYEAMRELHGYKYETPPCINYGTRDAMARFTRFAGALNPKFTPDGFDNIRHKIQAMERKERMATLEAMGVLYSNRCAKHFAADVNIDHAEFERMLNPNYAPTYADARRALGLPTRPLWWKLQRFDALENISRIPLNGCDAKGAVQMQFEDWYQLFWNYAMPFNAAAFYCLITSQQMIYTKEFVEELAGYLKLRLEADIKHDGQPIVSYGARIGKLAKLINDTKICPVPIIAVHEDPLRNPYALQIPPHCQKKFKTAPIEKLKLETALEKYKPAIVLLNELKTQQDITQDVRAHGCVKEYLTLGMPNSSVEGHGWQTFATMRYLEEHERGSQTTIKPAYFTDGFRKWPIHNVSRFALHRYDQRLATGFGGAISFHKAETTFDLKRRFQWFSRRLATRF
jgi:hypothetical protein